MRRAIRGSKFIRVLTVAVLISAAAVFPASSQASPRAIRITDASGRVVTLESLPKRLVVIGKGPHLILHLLYMFPEGRERLAGMEKRGSTASDFLDAIDPAFKENRTMGVNPGPEEIAALRPDLVLMKLSADQRMSEALAKAGIPVATLSLETPGEFFRDVANVGILLGNEARAAEIASFFRGRIERIQKALAAAPGEKRPRVLLVMATDRGGKFAVQVPAESWMQTFQVRTAGGTPVWLEGLKTTSGWTIVNLEQVAGWDPDMVFVVVWHSLDPQALIDSFKADPQWSALKAVRAGELYAFPQDIFGWDSPDPRWILGLTWLVGRIHPGLFKDTDMTGEVYNFYRTLFGLDRGAVERLIIPKIHLNVH
jgi:iron complex transport system substrate-binding protein